MTSTLQELHQHLREIDEAIGHCRKDISGDKPVDAAAAAQRARELGTLRMHRGLVMEWIRSA